MEGEGIPKNDLHERVAALTRRLGIIGAALLFLGYALPIHGDFSGSYFSLLLGPIGQGYHPPLQQYVFTPLEPLALIAVVLFVSLAAADGDTRVLGSGLFIGVGISQTLFFVRLVGVGLALHVAPWMGLFGGLFILGAGWVTWRGREL